MHKRTSCVYWSGKGVCADLVQPLFDTWWSDSKCITSLVLTILVWLLLSLSSFSSCGTTWPYGPAALRTQPCSWDFARRERPNTLCRTGEPTGPKPVRAGTGVGFADSRLLTLCQGFQLKHGRNCCVIILNFGGHFCMVILPLKKKN